MDVRASMSRADRKRFTVKTRQTCECGKECPPGPMARHVASSGHKVVSTTK